MNCNNCGAENTDDSMFCSNCGFQLNKTDIPAENADSKAVEVAEEVADTSAEMSDVSDEDAVVSDEAPACESTVDEVSGDAADAQPAQKKSMLKWLIIGGAALVAVVLLIVILVVCLSGGKYVEQESSIRLIVDEDEKTVIINNGKVLDKKIDGAYSMQYSNLKGDISTFLADGTLYCVDDDEVNKVADDVKSYSLAAEGTAVAFIDNEGDLYYVNLSKPGKKTSVEEDIILFTMSPDGKYVSYIVRDYENSSSSAYVFNGAKSVEVISDLSVGAYILGISNDCEYIYINDRNDENESELIVYTDGGENRNKVSSKFGELLYFNSDNTQMLFASSEGNSYVCVEGEEAVKVSGDKLRMVLPSNVTTSNNTCGINDFSENVYYIYDDDSYCIYYVNDDFEGSKIASNVGGSIQITNDGKYVYYMDDTDNLYVIKADEDAEEEQVLSNVDSFDLLSDAEKIYFKSNGDLYCYHGGSKVKKIKEDVSQFAVSGEDICFFMSDDNLYVSKNGKSAAKVVGNAEGFFCDAFAAYYVIEKSGSYQMYGSDGGTGFKLISKAVASD